MEPEIEVPPRGVRWSRQGDSATAAVDGLSATINWKATETGERVLIESRIERASDPQAGPLRATWANVPAAWSERSIQEAMDDAEARLRELSGSARP